MSDYSAQCSNWDNDTLIFKEVSHRRSIASYITSITLTAGTTVATAGVFAPLTIPIGAVKLYKIKSHKSKLKIVRAELAKRHLSPAHKRKRDVLVPVAITFTAYVATFGLADYVDIVPPDVQGLFEGHVENTIGVEQEGEELAAVGDKYEAFIAAEAVAPLTNAAMQPNPPPKPDDHAKAE